MVKWIDATNFKSPIGDSILAAAQSLYGDTLTPALKREQLLKAQRENVETQNLSDYFRDFGNAAATRSPQAAATPKGPVFTGTANPAGLPASIIKAVDRVDPSGTPMARGIAETAKAIGADPVDLATVISYETGGTMNPLQAGPTTQWGQHRGLIQFGEPQAAQYGVDFSSPENAMRSQLGPDGAIARYLTENGYRPGMSVADLYSTINAGAPGRYNASDANNGGAPGTVADKVNYQMGGHRSAAEAMFLPPASPSGFNAPPAEEGYNPLNAGQSYGELLARAIAAGMDPAKAMDAMRGMTAGVFGAENQATTDAFVGAGGNYANTYSGFASDQNRMERDSVRDDATARRGQDVNYDLGITKDENELVEVLREGVPVIIRKRDMQPGDRAVISDTENKAIVAQGMTMTPAQQEAYVGANSTAPKATWVRTPDGTTVPTIDGRTDANTGAPLPNGTLPVTGTGSLTDMGLDKLNARNVQGQVIAGEQFLGTIGRARKAATEAGPTAFGIIGSLRSYGQEAKAAIDAAAPMFGAEIDQTIKDTESKLQEYAAKGDPVAQRFMAEYDPSIPVLQMYARLLPYEAALAVADQSGRGLSDSDVKRFQEIVGNPLGVFGSQKAFMATLDTLEAEVRARMSQNKSILGGGIGAPVPPGAAGIPSLTPESIATMDAATYNSVIQSIADPGTLDPAVLEALIARGEALGNGNP